MKQLWWMSSQDIDWRVHQIYKDKLDSGLISSWQTSLTRGSVDDNAVLLVDTLLCIFPTVTGSSWTLEQISMLHCQKHLDDPLSSTLFDRNLANLCCVCICQILVVWDQLKASPHVPAPYTVCSFASPSAVGPLCDGACSKGIGGTFHTLGAAWWGVGSGLMNRVHLAESRGPQASLVQTRFTDQSPVIPPASSSHTLLLRLLLPGVRGKLRLPDSLSPPPRARAASPTPRSTFSAKHTSASLLCLNYLFLPMPTVNPQALAVGFSDSLALLSQAEQPADSFQPSSSTQPVALTVRW